MHPGTRSAAGTSRHCRTRGRTAVPPRRSSRGRATAGRADRPAPASPAAPPRAPRAAWRALDRGHGRRRIPPPRQLEQIGALRRRQPQRIREPRQAPRRTARYPAPARPRCTRSCSGRRAAPPPRAAVPACGAALVRWWAARRIGRQHFPVGAEEGAQLAPLIGRQKHGSSIYTMIFRQLIPVGKARKNAHHPGAPIMSRSQQRLRRRNIRLPCAGLRRQRGPQRRRGPRPDRG